MRSIGLDLAAWSKNGLLRFHATRPSAYGLEMHLATLHKLVNEFQPRVVILDPITTFLGAGTSVEVQAMLMRLIDFLKSQQITALFTSLTHGGDALEGSQAGISSLIDTWLLLRNIEVGGEHNRGLYILKSRGMAHSNQVRELLLTDHGVELEDVHVGPEGALTGSMRLAEEARERAATLSRQEEIERLQRDMERKRQVLEVQIAAQHAQFQAEQDELKERIAREQAVTDRLREQREEMARSRQADEPGETPKTRSQTDPSRRP
jgi:circadian clock protein KaiC